MFSLTCAGLLTVTVWQRIILTILLIFQLKSDFEQVYPTNNFDENFPLIKKRLLEILVDKGSNIRADPALSELLDLSTGK